MTAENLVNTLKAKIVLLGDSCSGKSTFLLKLFKPEQQSLTFQHRDFYTVEHKSWQTNHQTVKLLIFDTSGAQKYRAITKIYLKDCQSALIFIDCLKFYKCLNMDIKQQQEYLHELIMPWIQMLEEHKRKQSLSAKQQQIKIVYYFLLSKIQLFSQYPNERKTLLILFAQKVQNLLQKLQNSATQNKTKSIKSSQNIKLFSYSSYSQFYNYNSILERISEICWIQHQINKLDRQIIFNRNHKIYNKYTQKKDTQSLNKYLKSLNNQIQFYEDLGQQMMQQYLVFQRKQFLKQNKPIRQNALDQFNKRKNVMVFGGKGSGKKTYIKKLKLQQKYLNNKQIVFKSQIFFYSLQNKRWQYKQEYPINIVIKNSYTKTCTIAIILIDISEIFDYLDMYEKLQKLLQRLILPQIQLIVEYDLHPQLFSFVITKTDQISRTKHQFLTILTQLALVIQETFKNWVYQDKISKQIYQLEKIYFYSSLIKDASFQIKSIQFSMSHHLNILKQQNRIQAQDKKINTRVQVNQALNIKYQQNSDILVKKKQNFGSIKQYCSQPHVFEQYIFYKNTKLNIEKHYQQIKLLIEDINNETSRNIQLYNFYLFSKQYSGKTTFAQKLINNIFLQYSQPLYAMKFYKMSDVKDDIFSIKKDLLIWDTNGFQVNLKISQHHIFSNHFRKKMMLIFVDSTQFIQLSQQREKFQINLQKLIRPRLISTTFQQPKFITAQMFSVVCFVFSKVDLVPLQIRQALFYKFKQSVKKIINKFTNNAPCQVTISFKAISSKQQSQQQLQHFLNTLLSLNIIHQFLQKILSNNDGKQFMVKLLQNNLIKQVLQIDIQFGTAFIDKLKKYGVNYDSQSSMVKLQQVSSEKNIHKPNKNQPVKPNKSKNKIQNQKDRQRCSIQ